MYQVLDIGQANLNQWSFDAAYMKLCTYIYRNLSILGNNNKDFGVAYIRAILLNNKKTRFIGADIIRP